MKKIIWLLLVFITCISGTIFNAIYFDIIYQFAIIPIVELFGYQLPLIHWSVFIVGIVAYNAVTIGKRDDSKFYKIGDNGFFKEFNTIICNKALKMVGVILTYYIVFDWMLI